MGSFNHHPEGSLDLGPEDWRPTSGGEHLDELGESLRTRVVLTWKGTTLSECAEGTCCLAQKKTVQKLEGVRKGKQWWCWWEWCCENETGDDHDDDDDDDDDGYDDDSDDSDDRYDGDGDGHDDAHYFFIVMSILSWEFGVKMVFNAYRWGW